MPAQFGHSAQRTTNTEGHNMRPIYVFAAILAVTLAESSDKKIYEDLEAMETMELKKELADLAPAASAYNYIQPSQRPPQWNQNQNYVPPVPAQSWNPQEQVQPIHTQVQLPAYVPPPVSASPPYVPPVTSGPPSYIPPVTSAPPSYVPPVQSDYPQNNYPIYTWPPTHVHIPSTTPASVIKNEQWIGENGNYKYEYQLNDGTHVGEQGYFTDPRRTEESLVKTGWYSYRGADGKTYTVTYWADHTGYHAYGAHLPNASPVPSYVKAALEKDPEYLKTQIYEEQPPQQTYNPPQQTYNPPQQTYNPPQQTRQSNYYPAQYSQNYQSN